MIARYGEGNTPKEVEREQAICRELRVASGLSIKLKWSAGTAFLLNGDEGSLVRPLAAALSVANSNSCGDWGLK